MKRESKRGLVFTRRALMLAGGQLGLLGLLGARLYQVQVVQGGRYASLARHNSVSTRLLAPVRGRILDRAGTLLAGNKRNWRALLLVDQCPKPAATLAAFAALVPLGANERTRITAALPHHPRFIPLMVRDFLTWDEMARLAVHAPDLPGIMVDAGMTRLYPFSGVMAHVLGYVGPPTQAEVAADRALALPGMVVGRAGVEAYRDQPLRGTAGTVHFEVDARGRVIRELDREPGQPGADVTLTIDAPLQRLAMGALAARRSASAVLLDATSGAVLAMASHPSFDPSLFESGVSTAQWQAWVHDVRAPLLNKATDGVYPPGSTFKPVVAMAALAAGVITPATRFYCPGYFKLGTHKFYCWLHWGHGSVDLRSALTQSCDVFFYNVALNTGIDRIEKMAHQFAIGAACGLDLSGVAAGFVATRGWWQKKGHHWSPGDTVVQGIGQGFTLATPLGLATMVARMATGRLVRPYLAARIGTADAAPPPPAPMNLPGSAFAAIRAGLFGVVNDAKGTAYAQRLALPGVTMAGKTGSAQVISASTGNRGMSFHTSKLPWKFRPQALFIAYAPTAAPRYAVAVVVEHGNEGAQAAAPIARAIMLAALARDGTVQSQAAPAKPGAPA